MRRDDMSSLESNENCVNASWFDTSCFEWPCSVINDWSVKGFKGNVILA